MANCAITEAILNVRDAPPVASGRLSEMLPLHDYCKTISVFSLVTQHAQAASLEIL